MKRNDSKAFARIDERILAFTSLVLCERHRQFHKHYSLIYIRGNDSFIKRFFESKKIPIRMSDIGIAFKGLTDFIGFM